MVLQCDFFLLFILLLLHINYHFTNIKNRSQEHATLESNNITSRKRSRKDSLRRSKSSFDFQSFLNTGKLISVKEHEDELSLPFEPVSSQHLVS